MLVCLLERAEPCAGGGRGAQGWGARWRRPIYWGHWGVCSGVWRVGGGEMVKNVEYMCAFLARTSVETTTLAFVTRRWFSRR